MKNILLVSNVKPNKNGVGNPIMVRMQHALANNSRLGNVQFLPFKNSILSLFEIRNKARNFDIVHVHFGGMYALLIWIFLIGINKRKFITFHGTDIHAKAVKTARTARLKLKIRLNQRASFCCIKLYDKCGMVAKEMMRYVPDELTKKYQEKFFFQPLGVDYDVFVPSTILEAQEKLGLKRGHYVLFSDVQNTPIKRRDIANDIVTKMGEKYKLLIMCGVKADKVPSYLNAVDFLLLTSDEEGSPNIIREALAMNKRVYSVDVGDAAKQLEGLENSLIISRNPQEAVKAITDNLKKKYSDNTRFSKRQILDFNYIIDNVIDLYENC